MRTLARIASAGVQAGHELPRTLKALDKLDVRFRTCEVSVIAGPPGAGKTAFALYLALAMRVPTLYISADSGDSTQMIRCLSMLTGMHQSDAEKEAKANPTWAAELLSDVQIVWGGDQNGFDPAPSMTTIANEIRAYTEVYGEPPELVIIDSLYNVDDGEGESMWAGLMKTVSDLKAYASQADSAFMVLHHTSEQKTTGDDNPSLASLQGKVGPLPALVLTLKNNPDEGYLSIASVKNRYGEANRDGTRTEAVVFFPATMTIQDY